MSNENEFASGNGATSRIEVPAHRPILLDDRDSAWLIEAGTVDVFFVQDHNGGDAGPRRHVLRATSGDAIFGFGAGGDHPHSKMLAVGSANAALVKVNVTDVFTADPNGEPAASATALLNRWVTSLSGSVAPEKLSRTLSLAEPGKPFKTVSDEDRVSARDVVWVKQQTGSSRLLSDSSLAIPQDIFFPLTPETWIDATKGSTFECVDTRELQALGHQLQALDFLNAIMLSALAAHFAESDRLEQKRLSGKYHSDRSQIRAALSRLAAPLMGKQKDDFAGEGRELDLLVIACQMAAAPFGITMRGPAPSSKGTVGEDPLREIARASNVRMRRVLLRGPWWNDDHGPLLGYTQDKYPVALVLVGHHYELHDPRDNSRKTVDTELSLTLEPFAFTFYRPFPVKELDARDLFDFARKHCTGEIVTVLLTGTAGGLLGLLTPIFTGMIFDTIIPAAQRRTLLELSGLLLVGAIGTAMFDITRSLALLRVEGKMGASLQAAVWDRLLSLPVSFFRNYSAGDLSDRANGIDGIRRALTGTLANSIISGIFSLFNLALMFYYSWKLALVALGLVLIAVIATLALGKRQLRVMRELTKVLGKLSGSVFQLMSGVAKLRVSGAESRAFGEWAKGYSKQRMFARRSRELANRFAVFNTTYMVLGPMAIFYAVKEWAAPLSAGDFLAFNSAFGQMFLASMTLASAVLQVMGLVPYFERAKPILETMPEVDNAKAAPGELSGQIEVSHAAFRYQADKPPVLQDVGFRIEAGEFVAVVGPSGCGKSTLFRLLLGFERPETGVVSYDGKDLRGLDVQSVRRQMGVVLQNSFPFRGDIFANIIGSKPLTLDDAWEAARLAGLDEDIRQMPMGMHTVISETGGLSGGQRQRLMIARAIVSKPTILLFDEATSALDNQTQAIVSRSLEGLRATRIVIAHRLSTVVNASRILVLDQGRVVQSGTYGELLEQDGLFASLARRQLV
jgi:NHLM bacteriocin system ABC transporter ATP-binding protein